MASSSPSGPSSRRSSSRKSSARPTARPRRDPEQLHHLVAVEVGPDRVELLLLAQLDDAALELVHPPTERPRLGRVAGRAVAPGQLVQPVEQRSGVADVAAHRPVGPPEPVGVEPQVQLDQPGDRSSTSSFG